MNFMDIKIFPWLAPRHVGKVNGLGRQYDGSYIVPEADVASADGLISFGINDDWSFEKDFRAINKVPVHAFDASVDVKFFVKFFLKCAWKNILGPIIWLRNLIDYCTFFQGPVRHHTKFISNERLDEGSEIAFDEVMENHQGDHLFLKMDIEGGEYRVLSQVLKHQSRFIGFAAEFRNCDIQIKEIERFVSQLRMTVARVHANNYRPVRSGRTVLEAFEITFSRQTASGPATLPSTLDMPCCSNRTEIVKADLNWLRL